METYLRTRRQMLAAMVIVAAWAHVRPADVFDSAMVLMLGVPLEGWVLFIQRRHVWLVAYSAVCTVSGSLVGFMLNPAVASPPYSDAEISQYPIWYGTCGAVAGWLVGVVTAKLDEQLAAKSAEHGAPTSETRSVSSDGSPA
jgi:hypothetical protein